MSDVVSPTSTKGSPGSGKKRGKKRALTVEDLFTSVSTVKAYGDFPPPPRYVLSPRSAEACLREGVDPEQLRIRDLDSFWEPGIDASRQGMRHEAYAERRHSLMKNLRSARTAVINTEVAKQRRGGNVSNSIAEQMKAEEAKKESSAIEMEAKRLAKMQRRQQKEIEQLLAFEMKTAQIQEQAQLKLEQEMKRAERKKREVLRRQKLKAEEQRMKNLKRQAEEELEEKKRRALANQAYIKEQQLNEEKKRKDRIREIEARKAEEERMRKAEERRQETARILKQQADAVAARLAEMNEAERARKAFLRKQKEDNKLAMQRKREMIRRRIETSQLNLEEIEAQKKLDYDN